MDIELQYDFLTYLRLGFFPSKLPTPAVILLYLLSIDLIIVICSESLLFIKFHSQKVYDIVNCLKVAYIFP